MDGVVVLGFIGSKLNLIHEGIGLGEEVFYADELILSLFLIHIAGNRRLLLLELFVSAHGSFFLQRDKL